MIQIFENDLQEKDLGKVNELMESLKPGLGKVDFERIEAVMKNGFIFSARDMEKGGELIGMATIIPMTKLASYFANIEDVVVSENYRGQKIGKRLMETLIEKAKELQVNYLFLTSSESREAARRLYQNLGFQEAKTTPFKLFL